MESVKKLKNLQHENKHRLCQVTLKNTEDGTDDLVSFGIIVNVATSGTNLKKKNAAGDAWVHSWVLSKYLGKSMTMCFRTFSSCNRSESELQTVTPRSTLTTRRECRINGIIIMHCWGESHDQHRVIKKKKKKLLNKRTLNVHLMSSEKVKDVSQSKDSHMDASASNRQNQ